MKPYEGKHETLSVRVLPSVVCQLQCLAMSQKMVARTTRHLDFGLLVAGRFDPASNAARGNLLHFIDVWASLLTFLIFQIE